MTVIDARILLNFAIELFHNFVVHVLDLFFEFENLLLDWGKVGFKFGQFEFVNVFYFFHLVGSFEILDELGLLFLNGGLFILKLLDEVDFFLIV